MKKITEKPSFKVIYVLKFPKFVTTWRLKYITKDGFFIFLTSSGRDTEKMSLNKNVLRKHYYIVLSYYSGELGTNIASSFESNTFPFILHANNVLIIVCALVYNSEKIIFFFS